MRGRYSTCSTRFGREAAAMCRSRGRRFQAKRRRASIRAIYARVSALNDYVFKEQRFVGNDARYEDPSNSFLNEVLDRRTGIPVTLALVYIEVARRAGVTVEGVNMPGHFLVRCPARRGTTVSGGPYDRDLIIDAHHGAFLSEDACRELVRRHAGDETVWDVHALGHATKAQILARMLLNLKHVYVRMCSFPQASDITELLLASGSVGHQRASRPRPAGLSAQRLSAALRDLQRLPAAALRKTRSTASSATSRRRSGSTSRRSDGGSLLLELM